MGRSLHTWHTSASTTCVKVEHCLVNQLYALTPVEPEEAGGNAPGDPQRWESYVGAKRQLATKYYRFQVCFFVEGAFEGFLCNKLVLQHSEKYFSRTERHSTQSKTTLRIQPSDMT